MRSFQTLAFLRCVQVSGRDAMHLLTATVAALMVPIDDLVLNRTCLQEAREANRRVQYDESKANFIDNVIRILHIKYIVYIKLVVFLFFYFKIVK